MSAASEGWTAKEQERDRGREQERDRERELFTEKIQAKEKDLASQVGGDPCADLDAGAVEEEPSDGHMSSQYTHLSLLDDDEAASSLQLLPHTGVVIPGLQDDSDHQGSLEFRVRKHLRHYHISAYSPR